MSGPSGDLALSLHLRSSAFIPVTPLRFLGVCVVNHRPARGGGVTIRYACPGMKHWPYLLTALVMLVIFGCRWFGPSDLYDNDQPKTVAYTVDMVRHGRWLLPVDMLGRPATKPPMYNWISVPVVAAGWHS